MARHAPLFLLAAAAAALVASATAAGLVDLGRTAGWMHHSCGNVEECLGEYDVGGDGGFRTGRRLDEDDGDGSGGGGYQPQYPTQYISYAALMQDSVPCSVPGASYYNCQPGAVANPYTRGCSAITQCRG